MAVLRNGRWRMIVWRIAKKRHALDRRGSGGLQEAGRWHQLGQPVVYGGLTVEIAALEKLANLGHFLPADLVLVAMTLPIDARLERHNRPDRLPKGWNAIPPGDASAQFGAEFLQSGRALGMIVPSAIVPEAFNIVINPGHPMFSWVKLKIQRPFTFDQRLGRASK